MDGDQPRRGRFRERVRRDLIKGWERLAWHLDGITWENYLRLSWVERALMHDELGNLIDATEPKEDGDGGGGIRPKRMRK